MFYLVSIAVFFIMRMISNYLGSSVNKNFIVGIYTITFLLILGNYGCIFYYGTGLFLIKQIVPDYTNDGIVRFASLGMFLLLAFTCAPKKQSRKSH
ncbi:hypothetical protein EES38_15680 [Vibrio viridaestus]|uniref:Uncharacterized protein n=1 Tax=Vibrio viridaestus TaxID=2487322 RepID=A0A3N9TFC6_9VIBR|nr:hypothetical protein EES38_15680 [Vibrio viridaestus]